MARRKAVPCRRDRRARSLQREDLEKQKPWPLGIDVLALVACDSDYVPLVRKLNSIGTRVMLMAWDFNTDRSETRTSQALINECSYPTMMHEVIDNRANARDPVIDGLFVAERPRRPETELPTTAAPIGTRSSVR